MKVVLLCGGAGKRMLPFTEDKVLLRFLGKTLLEHQIALAQQAGLTDFIIVGSPGNIARLRQIAAGIKGIKAAFAVQKNPGGIGHALQSARRWLKSPVIVVNPNDLFGVDAYKKLLSPGLDNTVSALLAYEVTDYFPGGYLVADGKNNLQRIVEKPAPGREPSHLVTVLVHRHNRITELLEYIDRQPAGKDDVYERAIGQMAAVQTIKVVKYRGDWMAVKYPWHILEAVKYYLDNASICVSPTAQIAASATIDGKVILADNVRVLENAVIRGPVYVGANSIIGNSTLVRAYSHIGADCVIGFGSEIKGTYLGDGCQTHMNYLGDSVIGSHCNFGAGTITANWRFDEKPVDVRVNGVKIETGRVKLGALIGNDVKTGVNVSLLPGVKIAAGARVPPGAVANKDI